MPSTKDLEERREFRNHLQDVVTSEERLGNIALGLVKAIHRFPINGDKKQASLELVRAWVNYVKDNDVPEDNPYAIRYHITQFAAKELGEVHTFGELHEVDLAQLIQDGVSYEEILSAHVSPDILYDQDVAIVGGAARIALKMHAGVDIRTELPINDIDAVITAETDDVSKKADSYGVDLTDTKIVDGDVRTALEGLVSNVDCSINQVAIHNGKLLFSQKALEDIKEGTIRLLAKNDPLFGAEGVILSDGHTYINRVGFYRGLSFLLRGKGDRLKVSQENIDREKDSIGRYWQILLFVKLLPMQDEEARYKAVGHWHDIAHRLGVTKSVGPEEFLAELMKKFPDTSAGSKNTYDAVAQARWIVERLINSAIGRLYDTEEFVSPETYTEADLTLSETIADYDYRSFLKAAQAVHTSQPVIN